MDPSACAAALSELARHSEGTGELAVTGGTAALLVPAVLLVAAGAFRRWRAPSG